MLVGRQQKRERVLACVEREGPTPFHPEPGRETSQRRWYWRVTCWESTSMRRIFCLSYCLPILFKEATLLKECRFFV